MHPFAEKLLDSTILFSFDASGYSRHCPSPLKLPNLKGTHGIVTGASSGIGLALAKALLQQEMALSVTGRKMQKLQEAFDSASGSPLLSFRLLEMDRLKEVLEFSENGIASKVSLLVHNAGDMPSSLTITNEGYEHVFASQVLGPYILTKKLIELGKLEKGCRVIFVSSGGMYLKKLDISDLLYKKSSYNKYDAYANAKRAQVILTEMFAMKYPDYCFSAMHPGWVDTEGVARAMPLFRNALKKRLRSPEQGGDTILWLATEASYPSGKFWFDRKQAKTSLFSWTESTNEEKEELWNLCDEVYRLEI